MNFVFVIILSLFAVETKALTWAETIELTKKNSLELETALQQFKATEELEKNAYSGFLPKLSATARGTHSKSEATASTHSYSADLNFSQNLFSGFADATNWSVRKINTQQARIDLLTTQARLSQELKQLFAEAFFSQASIQLSTDILSRRKENLRSVKLQFEVGRENKGSLLLSESNVEQAEFDLTRARNEAETTLESFRRYLGYNSEKEILLNENIPLEKSAQTNPDFDDLVEKHIVIQKALNEEKLAQSQIAITRAEFLPSLDLTASYGHTGDTFYPNSYNWNVGLSFSVSLFDGLRDFASYRSNVAKRSVAEAQLKNTRLSLKRDLKRAYYDYTEAIQKEKIDQGFNKAAQIRADIARNKYKNGLLSFEEWDRIESELIQKQRDVLNSEKNRIIRQAQWERALAVGVLQ